MRSRIIRHSANLAFRIDEWRPEDAPARLAAQLAEELQHAANLDLDARTFEEAAKYEIQKTKSLKEAIFFAKEYRRNPPANPRRMERGAEYNLEAIDKQLKEAFANAKSFTARVAKYKEDAVKARARADALTVKLREAHLQQS